MSNTRSSQRSSSDPANQRAVQEMILERTGREWCLFVDRDGVINRRIVGDYVRTCEDFEWLPNARRALRLLRGGWAPHLVVVTNQQGVGKGLMSNDDLVAIHDHVQSVLSTDGVRVDGFQVCQHLEAAKCNCRKPRPELILKWLANNPSSVPDLSIMVGDSRSDIQLARNVAAEVGGCASIRIGGRVDPENMADASFDSLWDFAVAVGKLGEEIEG